MYSFVSLRIVIYILFRVFYVIVLFCVNEYCITATRCQTQLQLKNIS